MTTKSEKITDILKRKRFTYSIEVVAPRTDDEMCEFDSEMLRLECEPTFFAVTWHAKLQNSDLDIAPLRLAKRLSSEGRNVLLHLTCDLLSQSFLEGVLKFLQENGICNLLVMLGGALFFLHRCKGLYSMLYTMKLP